jgi:tetratricopeptide (TPR) repeat protein
MKIQGGFDKSPPFFKKESTTNPTQKIMKKYYKTLLSGIILMTLSSTFVACSESEAEETPAAAPNTTVFEFPALMERKGELANTEEWAKTKEKVSEYMDKLKKDPSDEKSMLRLVQIYIQEARVTGEHPYYYPAILKICDHILTKNPNSFEGWTFKSSVLMSQHRFKEAYETATRAKSLAKGNAYIYGVLTDANVELGRYEEAVQVCDSMQTLKPSLESYARVSYLREIYGNYPASIEAMKLAVQAGLPGSEPYCWCRKTLGVLFENTGKFKDAENEYMNILAARPDYAFAMEGMARVEKHRGNYEKALEWLNKATAIMPEFSFQEEMAEVMSLQGKTEEAKEKYKASINMLKEDEASGHVANLDFANVYVHLEDYDQALEYAKKEYEVRPENIDVNSMMAWIYFKKGEGEKALEHIHKAKRTGSNQPVLNARAGMIESKYGNKKDGAKYLQLARAVDPGMPELKENV